jgi:hypothetical protein
VATVRRHGLTIVTRNDRDFKRPGLKVFNPFKNSVRLTSPPGWPHPNLRVGARRRIVTKHSQFAASRINQVADIVQCGEPGQ